MENAYIYTRVSTLIQVDGFSLEAQEAEIRAFAEARKINIVGKYTDEGKSGKECRTSSCLYADDGGHSEQEGQHSLCSCF